MTPTRAALLLLVALFPFSIAEVRAALLRQRNNTCLTSAAAAVFVPVLLLLKQVSPAHHCQTAATSTLGRVIVTTLGGTISAALCTGYRPSSLAVHPLTGNLYVASAGAPSPLTLQPKCRIERRRQAPTPSSSTADPRWTLWDTQQMETLFKLPSPSPCRPTPRLRTAIF
jgi:hypothetical protein